MDKPVLQHHDAMTFALPLSHQDRARLNPARQHDLAGWLCGKGLYHPIEQPPRRTGEAAIGLLLNPLRDAAAKQIRTERLWRISPKHVPVSDAQLGDWHRRQPIHLVLDEGIAGLNGRCVLHAGHRAVPDLAIL
ncbi:MAG: hypothetical protein JWQ49_6343 [Edaphobacter sp.]|nr:hypothetical protein [Edaphobacter sp.]